MPVTLKSIQALSHLFLSTSRILISGLLHLSHLNWTNQLLSKKLSQTTNLIYCPFLKLGFLWILSPLYSIVSPLQTTPSSTLLVPQAVEAAVLLSSTAPLLNLLRSPFQITPLLNHSA